MMDIEISRMRAEDVPEVASIEKMIFSQPWSEQGFLSSLQSQDTLYLTVRAGGEIAGYCGLLQSFDEADITNVAVHPDYRRRGIARQMLQQLMQLGGQRGIARFTLEVRVGNTAAIRLYEKLGFESAGVRKNFYEAPKEDALIMWTK